MLPYRQRNAGAVIHTHSPKALIATLLWPGKEFRCTHLEMIKVGEICYSTIDFTFSRFNSIFVEQKEKVKWKCLENESKPMKLVYSKDFRILSNQPTLLQHVATFFILAFHKNKKRKQTIIKICTQHNHSEFFFIVFTFQQGIYDHTLKRYLRYDEELIVPIIENTPFEKDLEERMNETMQKYPGSTAILVRRHGIYVWGDTWQKAKAQ